MTERRVKTVTFKNNPIGRIERFLCEHKDDLDDFGGMFSSGMKTYTVAPFIIEHLEEIIRLAEPREDDSDKYVSGDIEDDKDWRKVNGK
jgi:hypothetical protein